MERTFFASDFKELGFDEKNKTCVINAGEDSAIKTMEAFLKQTNRWDFFDNLSYSSYVMALAA